MKPCSCTRCTNRMGQCWCAGPYLAALDDTQKKRCAIEGRKMGTVPVRNHKTQRKLASLVTVTLSLNFASTEHCHLPRFIAKRQTQHIVVIDAQSEPVHSGKREKSSSSSSMLSPGLIVRGKRRSIDLLHLRRLSSTTKVQSEVVCRHPNLHRQLDGGVTTKSVGSSKLKSFKGVV